MKNYYLFIALFSILSCDRDDRKIDAGITTSVSGKFSEQAGDPIPNAKIMIGEYIYYKQFDQLVKWVDSTTTDSNGKYQRTFTTTGNGDFYKLVVKASPVNEQKYFGENEEGVEIKNIGSNFLYDYNRMFNLYPCDVTFHTQNISVFPLLINHGTTNTFQNDSYFINEKGIIVRRLYRTKDYDEPLNLLRTVDNKTQIARFILPSSHTTQNTTQSIVLKESDFKFY